MVRAKFREAIKSDLFVYYLYDIKDGETPEMLAYKYYGDANRHWIILLANDIINPFYDWPLSYHNFQSFMIQKYGSIENAKSNTALYQKVITKTDSVSGNTVTNIFNVDPVTYSSIIPSSVTVNFTDGQTVHIDTSKTTVTVYDQEFSKNEAKRTIKIIDAAYASQIENELQNLLAS